LSVIFGGTVNSILEQYSIHYKGLRLGKHHFSFEIDDSFFENYSEGEIQRGKVNVAVELEKHTSMLEFRINITGMVEVMCDRCLEPFLLPIVFKGDLFVKFSETEYENSDEVWYVGSNEYKVNLAQYIYESISLSLPIQRYHGIAGTRESDCDSVMLNRLSVSNGKPHKSPAFVGTDPRWEKLRDFQIE